MESRILIGLILSQPTYLNIGPYNRASLNVTRVLVKLRLQEPSPLARHGSNKPKSPWEAAMSYCHFLS